MTKQKLGSGKIKYQLAGECKVADGTIFLEDKDYIVEKKDDTDPNRISLITRIPRHLAIVYITEPAEATQ